MLDFDILILTNGPGEITTWVKPVVEKIRENLANLELNVRISVVLSPCPNATGNEVQIASQYPQISRIQGAKDFFPFLLWGKTVNNWDWYQNGLVIFLGGDQFYTLIIAKRLGYQSLVYAEWEARWYRYLDYFAVMNKQVYNSIPAQFQPKVTIVGDLMADVPQEDNYQQKSHSIKTIGLLPGSKSGKLTQGVPFLMAIASYVKNHHPQTKFIIPVAPTITPEIIEDYANLDKNPLVKTFGRITGKLKTEKRVEKTKFYLQTSTNIDIELITEFPCYQELKKCDLCLTTIGANTAQLGSLAIPMIVLIPSYQWDAMTAWDGLLGMLVNFPFVGKNLAKLINWFAVQYTVKNNKLYAWPNIWAKKEIVPELIGYLKVEEIGKMVLDYLQNPEKLAKIKQDLTNVRGNSGASQKIADLVKKIVIPKFS